MVKRRHVFFIAGFDPKRAGHYHRLYGAEAARQSAVSGQVVTVGERLTQPAPHVSAWTARSGQGEAQVHTTIELLRWDDIVRRHWARSGWRLIGRGLRAEWAYLRAGLLRPMWRLSRPPVLAALLLPLALAAVTALMAAACVLSIALAPAIGALAVPLVAFALRRSGFGWLFQLLDFAHRHARAELPQLDGRLDVFAAHIAEVAARPEVDEVLVIGHSVGSILAVSALARAFAAPPPPQLVLLTLGQCIPLLGCLPQAARFRDELGRVATRAPAWVDVSSPIDWAAFPLVDPLAACGVSAGAPPALHSPRFHELFTHEGYRRLKQNRFRVHLQYLMAAERPGPYDYFDITAGPRTLMSRFDGRTA